MSERDLVDQVLLAALKDGALGPEHLERFAQGLRERADRILEERLRPVEARAAAFEKELAWRKEVGEAQEEEIASRTRAMGELQEDGRRLRSENDALKAEMEALRRQGEAAAAAHERLLAHHHSVLRQVAGEVEALPPALPWGYRRVRARLREIVALLRKETP